MKLKRKQVIKFLKNLKKKFLKITIKFEPVARLSGEKKERKIVIVRNEGGDITTEPTDIKKKVNIMNDSMPINSTT